MAPLACSTSMKDAIVSNMRDLDLLPLAGAFAVEQRHHRRVQRRQPGDLVGHDGADVVGLAGQLLAARRAMPHSAWMVSS